MVFLYNLAFLGFAVFYLPFFLMRLQGAEDRRRLLKDRLGIFNKDFREALLGKRIVWLHAVSVGEVLAAEKFICRFLEKFQDVTLVLTTVTPTGQKMALRFAGPRVCVCYFPFDLTFCVRRFFEALDPECLLLMETEIWPNLLAEARRVRVPVGILNGRLSQRSTRRYGRGRWFFRSLWDSFCFVLAQTEQDAERFRSIGFASEKVHVIGNMKFDNVDETPVGARERQAMRKEYGFSEQDRIWIVGSTHAGEERIAQRVFASLAGEQPFLKLLIAPRHIDRVPKILSDLKKRGVSAKLSSEASSPEPFQVLILNQMGILKKIYAIADVAFVGGSLIRHGGQNPIEPAVHCVPVIHGPYVANFENIYRVLDQEGGAVLVRDEAQLAFALRRLLGYPEECRMLGQKAQQIVLGLRGATERHLAWLGNFFRSGPQKERIHHAGINQDLFSTSR